MVFPLSHFFTSVPSIYFSNEPTFSFSRFLVFSFSSFIFPHLTLKNRKTKTRVITTEEKLIAVGAKIDPELHVRVKSYAQRHNMSMSLLFEEALKRYIEEKE